MEALEEDIYHDWELDFLCSIIEDADVMNTYPLYKSSDPLVLWLIEEMLLREESCYILYGV